MGSATEQEYRLKWNNHRSTILSVVDSLLEEESLVDVILSAESKFIKAHRVILSACSPYFRDLFRSRDLQDKAPVIVLKDVDFENLKSLVEYMYRGEANVSQSMLQSFIATAESLKIRGLADGNPSNNNNNSNGANTPTKAGKTFDGTNDLASKSFTAGPVPTSSPFGSSLLASTPNALNPSAPGTPSRFPNNKRKRSPQMNATNGGGILAARLAKMSQGLAADGSVIHPPPPATGPLFDGLNPAEMMLGGRPIPPALLAAAQAQLGNGPQLPAHHLASLLPQQQPTVKKSRKSEKPKANKQLKPQQHFQQQPQQQQTAGSNNNIDDEEGVLRIDDDEDDQEMTSDKTEKENRQGLPPGLMPKIKIGGVSSMKNLSGQNVHSNDDKSDGADQENGNGDSEEEEQQVEGPAENVLQRAAASGLINPWTGEPFVNEDQEENSMTGGGGPAAGGAVLTIGKVGRPQASTSLLPATIPNPYPTPPQTLPNIMTTSSVIIPQPRQQQPQVITAPSSSINQPSTGPNNFINALLPKQPIIGGNAGMQTINNHYPGNPPQLQAITANRKARRSTGGRKKTPTTPAPNMNITPVVVTGIPVSVPQPPPQQLQTPPVPPTTTVAQQQPTPATPSSSNNVGPDGRVKRLTNTEDVYYIKTLPNGETKFACKKCSKCFNLKCTLLRHNRHQHELRYVKHPCPVCGQIFKRTDHLKVHLKKIHNIESVSKEIKRKKPVKKNEDGSVVVAEGEALKNNGIEDIAEKEDDEEEGSLEVDEGEDEIEIEGEAEEINVEDDMVEDGEEEDEEEEEEEEPSIVEPELKISLVTPTTNQESLLINKKK